MKALLKNYHQSPRKVALVAGLIRGKSVAAAKEALHFLPKKASPAIEKLLNSAVANARSKGVSASDLFVKTITVNKGAVMRRARPFARGRGGAIRKTMSIVALELGTSAKPKEKKAAKQSAKADQTAAGETK